MWKASKILLLQLLILFKVNINNLFCTFKSLLQQAVCPAKDPFHDLRDAIEYVESKDTPQTKSSSEKVQTIGDFYAANIEYDFVSFLKKIRLQKLCVCLILQRQFNHVG